MINNIFTILLKIYLFIVGIWWIGLQIYLRLIAKKSSYELLEIKSYITTKLLIIFTTFIIIHFMIMISILVHVYRERRNKNPSAFFMNVTSKISWLLDYIYWKPLQYIYDAVAADIPGSGRFFLWLDKRWTSKKYAHKYFYTLIFLFDILPRLIMAMTFFIEIIFYNRIGYFLYTIFLIFIPIAFKIFLTLFIDCGARNMPVLTNYFSKLEGIDPHLNHQGQITYYRNYNYIVKPEYIEVINPEEEISLLLQLQSMQLFGLQIKDDMNRILPVITFTTSMMYFIAGVYRLLIIIT